MAPLKLRPLTKYSKTSVFFPNPLGTVCIEDKKKAKSFFGYNFKLEWQFHSIYMSKKSRNKKKP